jgi:hypothetical protein
LCAGDQELALTPGTVQRIEHIYTRLTRVNVGYRATHNVCIHAPRRKDTHTHTHTHTLKHAKHTRTHTNTHAHAQTRTHANKLRWLFIGGSFVESDLNGFNGLARAALPSHGGPPADIVPFHHFLKDVDGELSSGRVLALQVRSRAKLSMEI